MAEHVSQPVPPRAKTWITWAALSKLHPQLDRKASEPLVLIWDAVVDRIIVGMLSLDADEEPALHINLREEMALELAKLQAFLAERVVQTRLGSRDPSTVNIEQERHECLGEAGAVTISNTSRNVYEGRWKTLMSERWLPKSKAAFEREKSPVRAKLSVKPVTKNHFIPRWYIKDYWSADAKINRWRRQPDGTWKSSPRGIGEWGYRRNLYSHHLEAYFSLVDGDGKKPIRMLLAKEPLNAPQREALIGFIVIQMLRSPFLIEALYRQTRDLMAATDEPWGNDEAMPQKAYETLYQNNAFYDQIARPLLFSRWALITADAPTFILPDAFCLRATAPDGTRRVLVPLSPTTCFVTLVGREAEKRIVPFGVSVTPDLAQDIVAHLVGDPSARRRRPAQHRPKRPTQWEPVQYWHQGPARLVPDLADRACGKTGVGRQSCDELSWLNRKADLLKVRDGSKVDVGGFAASGR